MRRNILLADLAKDHPEMLKLKTVEYDLHWTVFAAHAKECVTVLRDVIEVRLCLS